MNILVRTAKRAAKERANRAYHRFRMQLEFGGWIIFGVGLVAWVIERVWFLISTAHDTFTWLAFVYNPLMMVGAAVIGGCAFHYTAKRNCEIKQIAGINEELYNIHVQRLDILGADNDKVVELPPARSG